jgi:diaminohydroxyphosphoribosylaminopyrimidine deaminase/5-amino-6-(5-phosphoribosylamino)uracil reductase
MVDAVAVGIGTAIADDPALTARACPLPPQRQPAVRVVFDTKGHLPIESKLVQTARAVPTWIVMGDSELRLSVRKSLTEHGVHIVDAACDAQGVLDLQSALKALGRHGVVDLLVEGGAHLAGALLAHDLVDEVHWFTAPLFLGANALASVVGVNPDAPSNAMSFEVADCQRLANNIYVVLRKPVVRGF